MFFLYFLHNSLGKMPKEKRTDPKKNRVHVLLIQRLIGKITKKAGGFCNKMSKTTCNMRKTCV